MRIDPYLFFDGNCREAFTRYQEVLGGELSVMTMADAPDGGGGHASPEQADLVIHASLPIGDQLLMGSDDPTGNFQAPTGIMVSVATETVEEARRIYDALSEGGQQTQPIMETFFSPAWGMCVDRFGTPWMVGADQPS